VVTHDAELLAIADFWTLNHGELPRYTLLYFAAPVRDAEDASDRLTATA